MNFQKHSHRYGEIILNSSLKIKHEIEGVVSSIGKEMIESEHSSSIATAQGKGKKGSIGKQAALNQIFRTKFLEKGWQAEKRVFEGEDQDLKMDFWKPDFGIDVAFNHRSFIGGDLLRLQAAAEVRNLIDVGIYICATKNFLKYISSKDCNSLVSFERTKWYLENFGPVITTPIYLIGLDA